MVSNIKYNTIELLKKNLYINLILNVISMPNEL